MADSAENNKVLASLLPEMIPIKGGEFMMGSNASKREQPIHKREITDFYIGKYPITNRQYAVFLNTYGSDKVLEGKHKGEQMIKAYNSGVEKQGNHWEAAKGYEDHPIVYVSWYGAIIYCEWLREETDLAYRLASEAEWEYAVRGGNKSQGYRYAGSNQLKEVGWYGENSHSETKPVGLKQANELGIYDMSGNVWEWCQDLWHNSYKGASKNGTAREEGEDKLRRVVRGGSWYFNDYICGVSYRLRSYANDRFNGFSFRVARY